MKVLWFSNHRFRDEADSSTGTWLGSMGRALVSSGSVELYNITAGGGKGSITEDSCGEIKQWLLPWWKEEKTGLPVECHVREVCDIVNRVKPDLIHVWGLESWYGLLVARGYLDGYKTLLDIQGIRFAVGRFFMGNLTAAEQRQCVGLKEFVRPQLSPDKIQKRYLAFRDIEVEIMRSFQAIAYQSEWSHQYLKMFARPDAKLLKTSRMLRREFEETLNRWHIDAASREWQIFVMCGGPLPYKGLHVVIRALAHLRQCGDAYRDVKLIVGGGTGRSGVFRSGYLKFIDSEIKRLGLAGHVEFVGALNARQICEQFQMSRVFVHASFIESYSLAVAEAMMVGVPCVISYAGAMPELAVDGESALYFPAGDDALCAERIRRLLDDDALAQKISTSAMQMAQARNGHDDVVARQLQIYQDVVGE